VEIVCVPSEAVNGTHAELIIARDADGKLFAQAVTVPGLFDPATWALSPDMLEIMPGLFGAADAVTPEYCTVPKECNRNEVLECISNPRERLFKWKRLYISR